MKRFRIETDHSQLQSVKKAVTERLIRRGLAEGDDGIVLILVLNTDMPADSYRITGGDLRVTVSADSPINVMAGCGGLLRDSRFDEDGIRLSKKRGRTTFDCEIRGAYLANHFYNYYHRASDEELEEYITDLAFWGFNVLRSILPGFNLNNRHDEIYFRELDRLANMYRAAHRIGMKVCNNIATSCTFRDRPPELAAVPIADPLNRRGNSGTKVCVSKPGALELLEGDIRSLLGGLKERGVLLDMTGTFPYDEGGCGCEQCSPWGANGFLRASKRAFAIAKEYNPDCYSILGTWDFDIPEEGEWKGLTESLKEEKWCDCIMADDQLEYPRYPLENGVPGDLPLVAFPEISMWGLDPWGGFGATVYPWRVTDVWHQTEGMLNGGFLYSEGLSEDLNKAVVAGLYEDYNRAPEETLRQYAGYELGCKDPDQFVRLIELIEKNLVICSPCRIEMRDNGGVCAAADLALSQEAFDLANAIDAGLPQWSRNSWRWRIIYIRALLDYHRYRGVHLNSAEELRDHEDVLQAMHELIDIYHGLTRDYKGDSYHVCVRPLCPEY